MQASGLAVLKMSESPTMFKRKNCAFTDHQFATAKQKQTRHQKVERHPHSPSRDMIHQRSDGQLAFGLRNSGHRRSKVHLMPKVRAA